MSLIEAIANVFVGYGVAVLTQILIFPVFGLHTTLAQNLKMGAVFTVVSIARSYVLRRMFERLRSECGRSRERRQSNPGNQRTSATGAALDCAVVDNIE
jgi:hypothetical protein